MSEPKEPVDNGGSAFPLPTDAKSEGRKGMSLRDYFAGQVMECYFQHYPTETAALYAYDAADAMLRERKKEL